MAISQYGDKGPLLQYELQINHSTSFKHFDWTSWRLHIFWNFWLRQCWAKPFGGGILQRKTLSNASLLELFKQTKMSLMGVFDYSVRYLGDKLFPRDKMLSFFLQVECRSPITLASLIWVSAPLDERCTTAVVMSILMKTYFFTSGFLPLAAGGGFGNFY